ncbi:hypothetical protein [Ralstonia phage RP13]|nr:hypothetical protein [Ralstonia phage RP13]
MSSLKIRFVSDSGVVSSIIRFWTWSQWSHVELWTPDGWLGARTDGDGVSIKPYNYNSPLKEELLVLEVPDYDSAIKFAYDQVGKKYDYGAIAGLGVREDWDDPSKWFCSEYIYCIAQKGGIELLRTEGVNRVTPRDLYMSTLLVNSHD